MPTSGTTTGATGITALGAGASEGSRGAEEADQATELGSLVAGSEPLARRSPPLEPGATLGRYVLGRRLGAGAMGAVYEAHDSRLDRPVALKLLHDELPELARRRMKQEALILARFSHPNIVEVFEVVHAPDRTFVVMELVRGPTLARWRAQEPPPSWQAAVRAYLQAGAGLAAAHAAGFVHRDFKPGNCILGDDGRVRVLDFGLAMALGIEALASVTAADAITDDATRTRSVGLVGTPAYMAPEQARGEPCDPRADQYAFCAALYEAAYGERPIVADTVPALLAALERGEIRPPPAGHRVPRALRRVLLRGLSRDPADRWPTMDALLAALRRTLEPRRRWLVPAVLVGALVPGAGAWLWWRGQDDPRCDDAAPLRGVWDDERRAQVEAAVLATDVPYAPTAWSRIERDLDEYAAAWTREREELCGATRTRAAEEATDVRLRCLDDRRVALRATVELLAAASPSRVEKAVPILADLPPLARCDDVEALRRELVPSLAPRDAARVEAVRELLWQAERLRLAGEYDDAERILDAAQPEVEALGHPTLRVEALLARGRLDSQRGRFTEAAQELEQGYLLAVESGLDDMATFGATHFAFVLLQQSRLDEALRWARAGLLRARADPPNPDLEVFALRTIGASLRRRGELDEALEHQQRALAILEGLRRDDLMAVTLEDLSHTLVARQDLDEALEHQERALALFEQTHGPTHPYAATSRLNLADVLKARGDLEGAGEQLRRALAIFEDAHVTEHPHMGATWATLGEVRRQQGRLDEAREALERALVHFEAAYGPSHPETAKTLTTLGSVLGAQGRYDEALTQHRRALASFEEALGPRHPHVGALLNNMGGVLYAKGDRDEALACFRRAAEIFEEALGPAHPSLAGALVNVATELSARGEVDEARTLAERSLAIKEAKLGLRHPDLVASLMLLAELALARHDLSTARELSERAVAIQEESDGSPHELARARWRLAKVAWLEPAQRDRARALARQARDAYATLGEPYRDELEAIEAWLAHPR